MLVILINKFVLFDNMTIAKVYPKKRVFRIGSTSLAVVIPFDLIEEEGIKRGDVVRFLKYKNDIILRFGDKND
jgi:hypothetical protein